MRRYKLYIIFMLMAGLAGACVKEARLPPNDTKPVTAVYAELIAGDRPLVHISRSKTVNNSTETRFDTVKNALVQLLDGNGQLEEPLPYNPAAPGSMAGGYTGKRRISAGKTYTVLTNVPGMAPCEGSAEIPFPFQLQLLDSVRTILNGRPTLRFQFNIMPSKGGIPQYMVLEALKQTCLIDSFFIYRNRKYKKEEHEALYQRVKNEPGTIMGRDTLFLDEYHRLPCYTQDEQTDNNQIGGLNESYSRIFFSQPPRPVSTYFYVNSSSFKAVDDDFIPKGRVVIYVKSVSKAYYDFLLTYEKIKRNTGLNTLFNAIQLKGNVNAGLGIIGGCNQHTYYLYFDEL
jgi:hypothetical protein